MKNILISIAIFFSSGSYGQALLNQGAYLKAEAALQSGQSLRAYEYYLVVDRKSLSDDEIQLLVRKMAAINLDSIADTCWADKAFIEKYIQQITDSTDADTKKIKRLVDSYYLTTEYGNTIYIDIYGKQNFISNAYGPGGNKILCAYPWMIGDRKYIDLYLSSAQKCLIINPVSYSKPVKEYTLHYLKLLKAINQQESLMNQTRYQCTEVSDYSYFYNKVNGLIRYPRSEFLKAIDTAVMQYRCARNLVNMEKECRDIKAVIDSYNLVSKKKTLYQKFLLAFNGDFASLEDSGNLAKQNKLLESLHTFCLKTEAIWNTDTLELEKKLKNAKTPEQVKRIVLQ